MSFIRRAASELSPVVSANVAPEGSNSGRRRTFGHVAFATSFNELIAWIDEHSHESLSVATLSAKIAMSPRNFSRRFLREIGLTPARYVENLRLLAAASRLATSADSLEEIAEATGFSSAEALRRVFKRRLKIAPSRYRQEFQNRRRTARADERLVTRTYLRDAQSEDEADVCKCQKWFAPRVCPPTTFAILPPGPHPAHSMSMTEFSIGRFVRSVRSESIARRPAATLGKAPLSEPNRDLFQ